MVVSKYMYRLEFIKYCAPLGYLFPKNLLTKFQPTFKRVSLSQSQRTKPFTEKTMQYLG